MSNSRRHRRRGHRTALFEDHDGYRYKIKDHTKLMLAIGHRGVLEDDERRIAAVLLGNAIGLLPQTPEEVDFLIAGLERFADEIDSGVDPEASLRAMLERDGTNIRTRKDLL